MKKRMKMVIAFVLLTVSLSLMSNTYSRYIADTNGDVDIEFAKWQILVNNNDIINSSISEINFTPTIEQNQNIEDNFIAPSSKGYFDINIDYTNVDVSFNYTITLNIENEEIPDLMMTKYAIIDSDYVEGNELNYLTLQNNIISNTLYQQSNEENKPFTIRVYFEWYEGENELMDNDADSVIGNKAANNEEVNFNINANIAFKQII